MAMPTMPMHLKKYYAETHLPLVGKKNGIIKSEYTFWSC